MGSSDARKPPPGWWRQMVLVLRKDLRVELSTGEVGYGLLENLVIGTYLPHGFDSPGTMAP